MIVAIDKPGRALPEAERVPAELRETPRWVAWAYEYVQGHWTKIPYSAATGHKASTTDRRSWCSFDEALLCVQGDAGYSGVGLVFAEDDDLMGIDLDDCVGENGVVEPWAQRWIDRFGTYTEISPSGTGVKLFLRGRKPGTASRKDKIEVYDRARYFTVTGRKLEGSPGEARQCQEALEDLYAEVFAPQAEAGRSVEPPAQATDARRVVTGLSDEQLLATARGASNGHQFAALFDQGDTTAYGGDESRADLALCGMLAFYTGPDPARIERLFSRSALGARDKWACRRDYRDRTIAKALEGRTEFYGQTTPRMTDAGAARDGEGEPITLDRSDPMSNARQFVASRYTRGEWQTLYHTDGEFFRHDGGCFTPLGEQQVRNETWGFLESALAIGRTDIEPYAPRKGQVDGVLDALRAVAALPGGVNAPAWLDGGAGRPAAGEIIPVSNGLLHVPTRTLLPATPAFWTHHALPYAYDASAPKPAEWIRFLGEIWPDDQESIDTLQELFGLYLTTDTSYQKIAMIIGPPRSGKGTIVRVLQKLIGEENVCGPTLSGLCGNFGPAQLIGRSVALISDARLGRGTDQNRVAELLLTISGEDTVTIDRKHRMPWTGKLGTRFVILSNEVPAIIDASGAFASRLLTLKMTQSFLGREDLGLTGRLLPELPGILNWALDGLERLRQRGRLVQPRSGLEEIDTVRALSSPVQAFVEARCGFGPERAVSSQDLYAEWKNWCESQGRDPASLQLFARNFCAAYPQISKTNPRTDGGRATVYQGIGLNSVPVGWSTERGRRW